ncbi:hypothetical protein [Shewanella xiamenensis]|uniref:hypothetical protein n=1 Tax=Shewanella xiamenensis TaxID=332186 RepID=UPI0024A7024B|nr:hypothetical protein [Shewanella xiamenensis]MDI5834902.1 hypothetical protein [Shewanella xiamenensis]MDI5838842.1 hypothetical protein [Shewanella xiamenensis]MDI5843051.1 hypothetical protein [Shewanella xiamenensis]MDI5849256.1 hypothetical protein [Shewanella xiamenensis]MDI5850824.1 hypothetical protein [Shewanella xiamenensis]
MSAEAFKIAQAILLSIGGGSLIIFVLSSWLGKVWANRILEADRNKYALEMESIRHTNKSITDALQIASSAHSESIKIYSELRCNAISLLWKEFLYIKNNKPMSVGFLDLFPEGKSLTPEAHNNIKNSFSNEKQSLFFRLNFEEVSPYLDEQHLELLYLYRKAIFRMHYYYLDVLSDTTENSHNWRHDELLVAHFKLVFDDNTLLKMQSENWSPNYFFTFVEKHLIGELRSAVSGELSSAKVLNQAMKNIDIVSDIASMEFQRES